MAEGRKNLLKKMQTLIDTRLLLWSDVRRLLEVGTEIRCLFSVEVHPVYRPRIINIAAVCMRGMLRQNEELIGCNSVLLIVYLEPSFSFYTVNQYIFVRFGMAAFAVMKAGMRVETNVGDVQFLAQWVLLYFLDKGSRQYDGTFTFESFFYFYHRRSSVNGFISRPDGIFSCNTIVPCRVLPQGCFR